MATSTSKTVLLIILVFVIAFLFLNVTRVGWHILGFRFIDSIEHVGFPFSMLPFGFAPFLIFLSVLWLVVIVWIYRDAEERGMNGILWALLVFVGNIVGLLIYLIVRSENLPARTPTIITTPCPNCKKAVQTSYDFCPSCGTRMKEVCPSCQKQISKDWQLCPYCGQKLVEQQVKET
jgi:RNA polymerase subunit RPABC4/transcription elongation factor Spt4